MWLVYKHHQVSSVLPSVQRSRTTAAMALRAATAVLAVVLCSCWAGVGGHTWLTDPPAHYQLFPRNGIVNTPCEPYSSNVGATTAARVAACQASVLTCRLVCGCGPVQHKPTRVKAGQEIDVTWGAMGHAGGYVRLSLAPKWWLTFDVPERSDGSGDGNDTVIFSSNVVKYDCFGGGTFMPLGWRACHCSGEAKGPCPS